MTISVNSRKQKARNQQKQVAELLAVKYNLTVGKDEDLQSREMGQSGVDIRMSRDARIKIPFDIECKAQEKLNIWDSIKQCENNTVEGRISLLIIKRNRTDNYAVLKFEDLLKLL